MNADKKSLIGYSPARRFSSVRPPLEPEGISWTRPGAGAPAGAGGGDSADVAAGGAAPGPGAGPAWVAITCACTAGEIDGSPALLIRPVEGSAWAASRWIGSA